MAGSRADPPYLRMDLADTKTRPIATALTEQKEEAPRNAGRFPNSLVSQAEKNLSYFRKTAFFVSVKLPAVSL